MPTVNTTITAFTQGNSGTWYSWYYAPVTNGGVFNSSWVKLANQIKQGGASFGAGYWKARGSFRFDASAIPQGATINSAILSYQALGNNFHGFATGTSHTIDIKVASEQTPGVNNLPTVRQQIIPGTGSPQTTYIRNVTNQYTADVTDTLQLLINQYDYSQGGDILFRFSMNSTNGGKKPGFGIPQNQNLVHDAVIVGGVGGNNPDWNGPQLIITFSADGGGAFKPKVIITN